MVRFHERVGSFSRMVNFDRRGTGLSDPLDRPLTLEQQVDDLDAVLEEVGMDRVALLATIEPGLCVMYAATRPERVSALVLVNAASSGGLVMDDQRREELLELVESHWGEGAFGPLFAPSRAQDPSFARWWTRFERASVTAAMARSLIDMNARLDLRGVLPAIRVPTLVINTSDNPLVPAQAGREIAELIPGARYIEAPGTDAYCWPRADDPEMDQIEEFITGRPAHPKPQRMLATVLFTDIVGSTDHASRLGDRAWRELLDRHDRLIRARLHQYRGREVKRTGDGFLATFDGPARAVACAREVVTAGAGELELEVRCGLHAGECELLKEDIGGIAVHIGARVMACAGAREVLVSSTIKDLVVGSELQFDDRGAHTLRGVPGEWRLFALRA